MKVKIKTYNGKLPSYLTVGKVYCVTHIESLTTVRVKDDLNNSIVVRLDSCAFLNGGSWEVVNE